MAAHRRLLTAGWILAGIILLFGAAALPEPLRVDEVSRHEYSTTAASLKKALGDASLMIISEIDHQNMLKMVGLNTVGSRTFEAFHPRFGRRLFEADPSAGLEVPLRFYVYERADGKTVCSYYRPSSFFGRYAKADLQALGRELDALVLQVVRQATQ